jgi:actin related protein 2/3 complex subunit 1A/1B
VNGISCHAWDATGTRIVLCPNNHVLEIYQYNDESQQFNLQQTLHAHTMLICAVDWNHVQDMIVSCSHDKSICVWNSSNGMYQGSRVLLALEYAALFVRWDTQGYKFAVSSYQSIALCFYEPSMKWYT